MLKIKNLGLRLSTEKNSRIILCLTIAIMFTVPISIAIATTNVQSTPQTSMINVPHELAAQNTQFQVRVAYAYVGPAPVNVTTYLEKSTNTTMRLTTQYPAVVRLNVTSISGIQHIGCDAIVEVYGIRVATNSGPTEYYAYAVGTNYNMSFSDASQSKLMQYVPALVNPNQYSSAAGNFNQNWSKNTWLLTETIGSITKYANVPNGSLGLFSEGKPNTISVSVYRIGYITITSGSVTVFEDTTNNTPVDTVQLNDYQSGFIYNNIMPQSLLPQGNLFQPIADP